MPEYPPPFFWLQVEISGREDEEAEMKYLKPDLHFNRVCHVLEIISAANFKFPSVQTRNSKCSAFIFIKRSRVQAFVEPRNC